MQLSLTKRGLARIITVDMPPLTPPDRPMNITSPTVAPARRRRKLVIPLVCNMMTGIVVSNSILIVDVTRVYRRHGMAIREAVALACAFTAR